MAKSIIALCAIIAAIILIRAIFRRRASARMIYALWLFAIIKLLMPYSFAAVEIPLPDIPHPAFEAYQMLESDTVNVESMPVSPATPVVPDSQGLQTDKPVSSAPVITPDTNVVDSQIDADAKASPAVDILDILKAVWLFGSVIAALIFAVTSAVMTARVRKTRRFHSNEGSVKVFVSDRVATPCVMGIFPCIYITPAAEECDELSMILLHEKTHIRHGDHIWAFIRIAIIIAFWWNPIIWAAALLSKRDAELACDESVVKTVGESKRFTYSRLILDMIPRQGAFAVAFASSPIKERILRLTGKHKTKIVATVIAMVAVLAICLSSYVFATHVHRYEAATCTKAATCECGRTKGKKLGHNWKDATCTEKETCERCEKTRKKALGHAWSDATCDSPKTCTRCSLTNGKKLDHVFKDATCFDPKTCTLCRMTVGKPLEHTWTDATCNAPKTCTACSSTEGKPLEHIWMDATCTSPRSCSLCGATDGSPLGHSYYFEYCTVCGGANVEFQERLHNAQNIFNSAHGISYSGYTQELLNNGYSQAEINYILGVISPDWEEEARKRISSYISSCKFYAIPYTKEDVYDHLISRGFDSDIAYDLTKKIKGTITNYYSSGWSWGSSSSKTDHKPILPGPIRIWD